jgi:hypothetical protein
MLHRTIITRSAPSLPKSATPGLPGMVMNEFRKGGEACQEVSRTLIPMLLDVIPLKVNPKPPPP